MEEKRHTGNSGLRQRMQVLVHRKSCHLAPVVGGDGAVGFENVTIDSTKGRPGSSDLSQAAGGRLHRRRIT